MVKYDNYYGRYSANYTEFSEEMAVIHGVKEFPSKDMGKYSKKGWYWSVIRDEHNFWWDLCTLYNTYIRPTDITLCHNIDEMNKQSIATSARSAKIFQS